MITYDTKYMAEDQYNQMLQTLEPMQEIAKTVLEHFGITSLKPYQVHLRNTGNTPDAREKEVGIFSLLEPFR